jgi:hypothetical protein
MFLIKNGDWLRTASYPRQVVPTYIGLITQEIILIRYKRAIREVKFTFFFYQLKVLRQ